MCSPQQEQEEKPRKYCNQSSRMLLLMHARTTTTSHCKKRLPASPSGTTATLMSVCPSVQVSVCLIGKRNVVQKYPPFPSFSLPFSLAEARTMIHPVIKRYCKKRRFLLLLLPVFSFLSPLFYPTSRTLQENNNQRLTRNFFFWL